MNIYNFNLGLNITFWTSYTTIRQLLA